MRIIRLAALGAALAAFPAAAEEDLGPIHKHRVFHFVQADLDFASVGGELSFTWEGDAWVGFDYNKVWIKSEGDYHGGALDEGEIQLLYSRYLTTFFDLQAGIRHDVRPDDFGQTTYAVIGLQGLAPYWFEADAAFFISEHGEASFRAELEYDILVTQRLIVQPYFEADVNLSRDLAREVFRGIAEIDSGIKVRYEIRREFAPYVDFNFVRTLGGEKTAALLAGERVRDFVVRIGARVMF